MSELPFLTPSWQDPELDQLLHAAKSHNMTPEEKQEQRISFAHGNVSMHNPEVTREMVEKQAARLGDCQYRHDWINGKCNTCGAVDSIKRIAALEQENERLKAEVERWRLETIRLRSVIANASEIIGGF